MHRVIKLSQRSSASLIRSVMACPIVGRRWIVSRIMLQTRFLSGTTDLETDTICQMAWSGKARTTLTMICCSTAKASGFLWQIREMICGNADRNYDHGNNRRVYGNESTLLLQRRNVHHNPNTGHKMYETLPCTRVSTRLGLPSTY